MRLNYAGLHRLDARPHGGKKIATEKPAWLCRIGATSCSVMMRY